MLLKWLKQWDHVVFDKELKPKKPEKEDKKQEKDGQKKFFKPPEVVDELDEHNRPMQKVILEIAIFGGRT